MYLSHYSCYMHSMCCRIRKLFRNMCFMHSRRNSWNYNIRRYYRMLNLFRIRTWCYGYNKWCYYYNCFNLCHLHSLFINLCFISRYSKLFHSWMVFTKHRSHYKLTSGWKFRKLLISCLRRYHSKYCMHIMDRCSYCRHWWTNFWMLCPSFWLLVSFKCNYCCRRKYGRKHSRSSLLNYCLINWHSSIH